MNRANLQKGFFQRQQTTIRLTTFYDDENLCPFIPYSFMRFGRKNSFPADNIARGGIFSMIDVSTGKLTEAFEVVKNKKPIIT